MALVYLHLGFVFVFCFFNKPAFASIWAGFWKAQSARIHVVTFLLDENGISELFLKNNSEIKKKSNDGGKLLYV